VCVCVAFCCGHQLIDLRERGPVRSFCPAKKTMYWVPDDEECWIPATLLEEVPGKGVSRFSTSSGRTVEVKTEKCLPIQNDQNLYDSPDDLISLSEVNEATILNAINIRFGTKRIYTACGAVLMVLNPFEIIENMYGDAQIDLYSNPYAEGLLPHIYLISSRAYSLMCSSGKNQSILIR
jgi:myosin-5